MEVARHQPNPLRQHIFRYLKYYIQSQNNYTNILSLRITMEYQPEALLDRLPDELILGIVEQISQRASLDAVEEERRVRRRMLYALCLTSRRLHQLTTAALYGSILHVERPFQFIRTMVTVPDLAKQVKLLTWRYATVIDDPPPHTPSALSSGDIDLILDSLKTPFAIYLGRIVHYRLEDHPDQLTLAMVFLPNIAHLVVDDAYEDSRLYHRTWVDLIKFATPHSFQNLSTVTLDAGAMQLNNILPLILHPAMRKIEISHLVEADEDWHHELVPWDGVENPSIEWRRRWSRVEHLSLFASYMDSLILATLLGLFRSLKTFAYGHDSLDEGNRLTVDTHLMEEDFTTRMRLDHSNIINDLGYHRHSLEELWLDEDYYTYEMRLSQSVTAEWSFSDYPKLKRLTMNFLCFIKVDEPLTAAYLDRLPAALEYLHFTMPESHGGVSLSTERLITALEYLAENCRSKLPHLKRVEIDRVEIQEAAKDRFFRTSALTCYSLKAAGVSYELGTNVEFKDDYLWEEEHDMDATY
jgi:hypothetical protein